MTIRITRLASLGAAGLLALGVAMPAAAQDKVSIEMIQSNYNDSGDSPTSTTWRRASWRPTRTSTSRSRS